ncbi:MAG: YeeE/YedE family protein, partial [Myxococcales bacterium]|nr:YeeE/YedE family protein [Myxococcales bacterium]
LEPRVMSYTGWAHVLGGVLFGASMGITGICPGTAVCRAGANFGSSKFESIFAVVGLFVGVAIFSFVKTPLFDAGVLDAPQGLTLYGWLGLPYGPVAILFGIGFLVLTALLDRFGPERPFTPQRPLTGFVDRIRGDWHFGVAGVVAGLTVVWATMQDGYIGYSGSILAVYGWVADAIGSPTALVPKVTDGIVWRAGLIGGVLVGAIAAKFWSIPCEGEDKPVPQPTEFRIGQNMRTMTGALGLSLGAMIGGGCTTGAFMAAFPTLSIGSFAMGGTFFAVGVGTAYAVAFARRPKMAT